MYAGPAGVSGYQLAEDMIKRLFQAPCDTRKYIIIEMHMPKADSGYPLHLIVPDMQ